jgi:hypothetical protein
VYKNESLKDKKDNHRRRWISTGLTRILYRITNLRCVRKSFRHRAVIFEENFYYSFFILQLQGIGELDDGYDTITLLLR